MSWDYDPTKLPRTGTPLSSSNSEEKKNFVRLLVGDTIAGEELIQDEEIAAFLITEPNVFWAAAMSAEAIFNNIMRGGAEDQKVGETRIRMKNVNEFLNLSRSLRARGGTHMLPTAGGVYQADRDIEKDDTSKIKPNFEIGMHDFLKNVNDLNKNNNC